MPKVTATITNDKESKTISFFMDFDPDGSCNEDQAEEALFDHPDYMAMENADGTDADHNLDSIELDKHDEL